MSNPDQTGAHALSEQMKNVNHYYRKIKDPNRRADVLQLLAMLPHMETEAALDLVEGYFPLADMIREYEGARLTDTSNDNKGATRPPSRRE